MPSLLSGSLFQPFQLFGTLGCHLCEQARSLLMPWIEQGLQVEHMDIAEHHQWFERYCTSIPVLRNARSAAELYWPFDEAALRDFLCGTTRQKD